MWLPAPVTGIFSNFSGQATGRNKYRMWAAKENCSGLSSKSHYHLKKEEEERVSEKEKG